MGGNADIIQVLEHEFGNPVVQDTLAFDDFMLLGVEGGGVILEVLDEGARLGALIEDFGLAFVNATTAVHVDQPWLENVHRSVAPF